MTLPVPHSLWQSFTVSLQCPTDPTAVLQQSTRFLPFSETIQLAARYDLPLVGYVRASHCGWCWWWLVGCFEGRKTKWCVPREHDPSIHVLFWAHLSVSETSWNQQLQVFSYLACWPIKQLHVQPPQEYQEKLSPEEGHWDREPGLVMIIGISKERGLRNGQIGKV